ncbi:hypothetical protein J6590_096449 [Homalodisca vitripennis]|nr:hypothetical protein J6590_096449 [Homalodisca vitripennis]
MDVDQPGPSEHSTPALTVSIDDEVEREIRDRSIESDLDSSSDSDDEEVIVNPLVGHAIYIDNFYNSVHLATELMSQNTYCTGTLRANRQDKPEDETIARYSNGAMVGAWRDKRKVM